MRPKKCEPIRRYVRKFREDILSLEPRHTLREIYDSMVSGTNLNSTIRRHTPLEPDGDNPEDFEAGTREITDLVDQQHLEEDVQKVYEKLSENQRTATEAQQKEAFEKAVEEEIQRRASASVADAV